MSIGDEPTSKLLRDASAGLEELLRLLASFDVPGGERGDDLELLASELRIRARFLEGAAADKGGHDASRRTLLVGLGEVRP